MWILRSLSCNLLCDSCQTQQVSFTGSLHAPLCLQAQIKRSLLYKLFFTDHTYSSICVSLSQYKYRPCLPFWRRPCMHRLPELLYRVSAQRPGSSCVKQRPTLAYFRLVYSPSKHCYSAAPKDIFTGHLFTIFLFGFTLYLVKSLFVVLICVPFVFFPLFCPFLNCYLRGW